MEGADERDREGADDRDNDEVGDREVEDDVGDREVVDEVGDREVVDVGEFVDIGLLVEVDGLFEESFDGLFEETYSYEEGGFPKRSKAFKLYLCTRSLRPIASWRSARVMTISW